MRPPKTTLRQAASWAAYSGPRAPTKLLSTSGMRRTKKAPKTAPKTVPAPPTMTMARYWMLTERGKYSGVTAL